jgi:hypothetical protein
VVQRGTEGANFFGHGGVYATRPRSKIGYPAFVLRAAEPVGDSLLPIQKLKRLYVLRKNTVSALPDAACQLLVVFRKM